MEQAQGAIEEILAQLRAIHKTLESIEQLLDRSVARVGEGNRRDEVAARIDRSSPKAVNSIGPHSRLLTVAQVAEILGQSVATVRKWGHLRQIEVVRLGRSVRITRAEVERLIARGRQPISKVWQRQV